MAIERIDTDLCNGCGICVDTCWMDVLCIDETSGKATIKYANDCLVCTFCELDCPENAIFVSPATESLPLTLWGI